MTKMRRKIPLLGLSLVGLSLLAGCDATDPYKRTGNWQPRGSNDINLAAMVAVPSDLARGVADDHLGNGQTAATAGARQLNEKAYPLPDSAIAKVTAIGSGSSAAPGDAGSSGGQAGGSGGGGSQ